MIPEPEESKDACLETDSVWNEYKDDDIEPEASPATEVEDESTNGPPSGP